MSIFKRRYRPRYEHVANRATASRAIFQEQSGAIPKISLTFDLVDGSTHTFELEAREAAKLIEQTFAAYNAIYPPLKTSRGGFGL